MMKTRDTTRENAVRSNRKEDWDRYKVLRNKCTAKVRQDRKDKQNKYFQNCIDKNDARGLFNIAKNRFGDKDGGPPTQFQLDGRAINKPGEIAEIQINYFSDKITKLKRNMAQTNTDPLQLLRKAI